MPTKLNVTKIVLTPRGGQDVSLTIEEARDLYIQLDELFAPRLAPQAPVLIESEGLPQQWRPFCPLWTNSPGSADYPQALPYVTCQAPSGLHTSFMGDEVKAPSAT